MQLSPTARTWAEIDLGALKHNLFLAKATGKKVMCVIKANAYGHGAVRCGLFLEQNGADAFAVACLDEALELRAAGITLPLLVLGYTPACYASVLIENGLTQAAVDEEHALLLSEEAEKTGKTLKVHIKLDTGMSRLGIFAQGKKAAEEAARAVLRVKALKGLYAEGLFTHFAAADDESENAFTAFQLENYNAVLDALKREGFRPEVCHTSNSACILDHPETQIDMVREGIMLYGLYPNSAPQKGPLKPVMALKTRVAQVKTLPKGATVSYGRTFEAGREMKIAVLPAGYADGLSRRLSGKLRVLINGKAYPQVGRICMDMCMADITNSEVARGDAVILFGANGMSTEEAAMAVGTINYELTCLVTPRAHRVYVNG